MVSHYYENREETSRIDLHNIPCGAAALIAPFRCVGF
ncbi:MAG: phage gp6-like head-tail connector protein [Alphaproteobacteria bacterium]|nr:phage gp6-like head-tail connector protein [Alphaproteobacteria bacterium]